MKNLFIALLALAGTYMLPTTTFAQTNQQVADEIMNMVRAQWAADMADPGNINVQFKDIADDYTEFNGDYATRIDGKAVLTRITEANGKDPGRRMAAEMLNPKVQVYGDVAILSYNYAGVSKNKDGEMNPVRAKSTRVYAKQGGKWKLVHANFGSDPLPK